MSHNAQQSKVSASRLQRGASGERKTTEALARLHSARSFNHSHCFTAEGWGSSLTPLGLRSFLDVLCDMPFIQSDQLEKIKGFVLSLQDVIEKNS